MCSFGKLIDPLGIDRKIHAAVEPLRDKVYNKLGLQSLQIRNPMAEAGGASKYLPDPTAEVKPKKATPKAPPATVGRMNVNGLVI